MVHLGLSWVMMGALTPDRPSAAGRRLVPAREHRPAASVDLDRRVAGASSACASVCRIC